MSETPRRLGGWAWALPIAAIVLPLATYFSSLQFQAGPQLRESTYNPDPDRGAALFKEHCANCHGAKGAGDGPMAKALAKPPRDLVQNPWVFAKDLEGLKKIIKEGIPQANMPATQGLSRSDMEHLAAYTWKLAPREKSGLKEKTDEPK